MIKLCLGSKKLFNSTSTNIWRSWTRRTEGRAESFLAGKPVPEMAVGLATSQTAVQRWRRR